MCVIQHIFVIPPEVQQKLSTSTLPEKNANQCVYQGDFSNSIGPLKFQSRKFSEDFEEVKSD